MRFSPKTPDAKILVPLLDALNWQGDRNKLGEVLESNADFMKTDELLEILLSLNFRNYKVKKFRGKDLDERTLPILLVNKNQHLILMSLDDRVVLVYDANLGVYKQMELHSLKGEAYVFKYAEELSDSLLQAQDKWFSKLIYRFKKTFFHIGILTLLITLLDLMLPLLVILIYDRVLTANSVKPIFYVTVGLLIYTVSTYTLNSMRSQSLNYVSTRLGSIISLQTFTRLMYLSPSYTETASINSQISRIKDFEGIKNFVVNGHLISVFDLMFSFVYLIAIFMMGGFIGVIPILTLFVLIVVGTTMRPLHQLKMSRVSENGSMKQQNLMELLKNTEEVKTSGSTEFWMERFKKQNSAQIMSNYELGDYISLTNNFSYFITNASVLLVIYIGVLQVFSGQLTTGALIGILMLYWKIIGSIRTAFGLSVQINALLKSIAQINRFMKLEQDSDLRTSMTPAKDIKGYVRFVDVSIRYRSESAAALLNVNFINKPGEILGITGHDGSGKSTILKLILGMYKPQAGRIIIDNVNIKQIEPLSLRKSIAYTPEKDQLVIGAIRDNFLCYNPNLSDAEISELIDQVGLQKYFNQFGLTLESMLDAHSIEALPMDVKKLLNLARMLGRKANLYLIDEPENYLNQESLFRVIELMRRLAKHQDASVIISTKNAEVMKICDHMIALNQGRIVSTEAV